MSPVNDWRTNRRRRPVRDLLSDRFDQSEAFALPMAGTLDDYLVRRACLFNLEAGGIVGRKQRAARDRQGGEREPQRKLGLQRVAEDRAALLAEVEKKVPSFDRSALANAVREFGGVAAKKFFAQSLGDEALYYGN